MIMFGKKKSKFRVFKHFFGKKKKRSSDDFQGEKSLTPSLSSSNINITSLKPIQEGQQIELRSNLGNKALSHDSIFMLDPGSERSTKQCSSMEVQRGRSLQISPRRPRKPSFSPPRIHSGTISRKYEEILIDNDLPRNLQKKQFPNKISLKKLNSRGKLKYYLFVKKYSRS
ncbi:acrosomal protein KIAA1210-like [Thomomys bottae]